MCRLLSLTFKNEAGKKTQDLSTCKNFIVKSTLEHGGRKINRSETRRGWTLKMPKRPRIGRHVQCRGI